MIPRFVSETIPVLNEKSGNPIVGIIIVAGSFALMWAIFAVCKHIAFQKNPP